MYNTNVILSSGRGGKFSLLWTSSTWSALLDEIKNLWHTINSFEFSPANVGRFLNLKPALVIP